jgi:hypothetical protein
LNVSSTVQSRAPNPTLRTTKFGSGSSKGYEKRLPCTNEHIKRTCRINESKEKDGYIWKYGNAGEFDKAWRSVEGEQNRYRPAADSRSPLLTAASK